MLDTAPVMFKKEIRNLEFPSLGSPSLDFASIASFVDNDEYCCLCLASSEPSWTCPLLNERMKSNIVSYRNVNYATFAARNSTRLWNFGLTRSDGINLNTFYPGKRSPKYNGRTAPSSYRPGTCTTWSSGVASSSTNSAATVKCPAAATAQPASTAPKN